MDRRRFLLTVGAGAVAGLAGCSGGDDTTSPDDPDGDPVMDTGTPTATPTEEGPLGETPTQSLTEPTPTDGAGTDTPVTAGDIEVRTEPNFRFRISFSTDQGTVTHEGRWHGDDFASTVTGPDSSGEVYYVDGTSYVANQDACERLRSGGSNYDTTAVDDSATRVQRFQEWDDVTATDTATVDGETVYVFEVDPEGRSISNPYTYYVNPTTGYVRRIEGPNFVVEYWDWGDVGPISAPC